MFFTANKWGGGRLYLGRWRGVGATGGGPAAGVPSVAGGGAAGSAGAGGTAGDPGECVSCGAVAGRGVGGCAAHPAGMLREELGDPWDVRLALEDWVESW